jgi:hypothetical protein
VSAPFGHGSAQAQSEPFADPTVALAHPRWLIAGFIGSKIVNKSGKNTEGGAMKKVTLLVAALAVSNLCVAQVGSTVSEGAKATAEKAKEAGDRAKAAVSSEPDKTVDKAKAQVHKAKAHYHAKKAKEAAKDIPK